MELKDLGDDNINDDDESINGDHGSFQLIDEEEGQVGSNGEDQDQVTGFGVDRERDHQDKQNDGSITGPADDNSLQGEEFPRTRAITVVKLPDGTPLQLPVGTGISPNVWKMYSLEARKAIATHFGCRTIGHFEDDCLNLRHAMVKSEHEQKSDLSPQSNKGENTDMSVETHINQGGGGEQLGEMRDDDHAGPQNANLHRRDSNLPNQTPRTTGVRNEIISSNRCAQRQGRCPQTTGNPPLDAPPFQAASVRGCIKLTARVQYLEKPDALEEILIPTSVFDSVNNMLSVEEICQDSSSICSSDLSVGDFSDTSESEDECALPNQGSPMKAFLKGRRPITINLHGAYNTSIYHARVLQKEGNHWLETGEEVAIKEVSLDTIRMSRGRTSEDFVKEIEALQYVSDWHHKASETDGRSGRSRSVESHVLMADVIMSDRTNLYFAMPYCAEGDLCQRVASTDRYRMTEDEARFWFRQILKGLESLQLMRICHKDLSPENLIILDDKSLVIDFGMCLRIPYSEMGAHLITPKVACGKLPHVAPEIFEQQPFDGHAVDIWAAGTILHFMLTGQRFHHPLTVELELRGSDWGISNEAMDLLRKMLRLDPNDRMRSLEQIKNHNWVL